MYELEDLILCTVNRKIVYKSCSAPWMASEAFLARRRLKATRLPVETVMSPKLQSLCGRPKRCSTLQMRLGILLDPVPERRQKVWTAEPFLEADARGCDVFWCGRWMFERVLAP